MEKEEFQKALAISRLETRAAFKIELADINSSM